MPITRKNRRGDAQLMEGFWHYDKTGGLFLRG